MEAHCKMSAAQFAAQAEITSHPSHHYLQLTDDRDMKKGLRNHLEECREKFQMPYEIRGREAVKMLHSDFVTEELEKYPVNKLQEQIRLYIQKRSTIWRRAWREQTEAC